MKAAATSCFIFYAPLSQDPFGPAFVVDDDAANG
jgi:hypothetical protein